MMESRRDEQLKSREQARARRASEIPEQREERLKTEARRARETSAPEERETKLETHGRRRTCEAHEKREANLQQTSDEGLKGD